MATISKLPSGKWQAKIRMAGESRSSTFRTKAEAQAWASSIEAELSAIKSGGLPDKTLGMLLERYIDEVIPAKRGSKADTLRMRRIMRDDALASVRLRDLAASDFAAWRDRRLKEVSVDSVLRELSTLSHACTVAMQEWNWLHDNPVRKISKPSASPARNRLPTEDEINRLLIASGYEYDSLPETITSRVGAALLFALETAMRAGEICGIMPEHIDYNRRLVHLPKTKNGHARDVPLSLEAVRLLRQLEPLPIKEGQGVFRLGTASLDAIFRKLKARAMIEDLHFHDSRAAALTRLARKFTVMELAKISGHRDLRILMNTYYREDPANLVSKLDD